VLTVAAEIAVPLPFNNPVIEVEIVIADEEVPEIEPANPLADVTDNDDTTAMSPDPKSELLFIVLSVGPGVLITPDPFIVILEPSTFTPPNVVVVAASNEYALGVPVIFE
jgi:hypothetical protein